MVLMALMGFDHQNEFRDAFDLLAASMNQSFASDGSNVLIV